MAERVVFLLPPFFRLLGSQNRRMLPAIHGLAEAAAQSGFEAFVLNSDHDVSVGDVYADWYSIAHNWGFYQAAVEKGDSSFEEMIRDLRALNPSAVVIGVGDVLIPTVDLGSLEAASFAARRIREEFPEMYIVAYGPQVTFNATHSLAWSDCVLRFEGELSIVEVLKDKPRGIVEGAKVQDVHMDVFPFLDPSRLVKSVGAIDLDYILASRGCAFSCVYCLAPVLSRQVRRFSIPRFLDEMEFRFSEHGVKWFYIADMVFEPSKKRALELCNAMTSRGFPEKGIRWTCESRIDTLDREKAEAMREAGCTQVKLGVEAGTDEQLQAMDKGITTIEVEATMKMLKEVGIKRTCYVLLGQVGTTKETYQRDYEFLRSLDADYYVVNVSVPYKGTRLYDLVVDDLKKRGALDPSGVEKSFMHLSRNLADFWNLDADILEKFLQLSGKTVGGKEDSKVRQFVRRLL